LFLLAGKDRFRMLQPLGSKFQRGGLLLDP
jgi:hypothetical protein